MRQLFSEARAMGLYLRQQPLHLGDGLITAVDDEIRTYCALIGVSALIGVRVKLKHPPNNFLLLSEPSDICSLIFLGSEADLAIIAALNDMNRNIDWGDSW